MTAMALDQVGFTAWYLGAYGKAQQLCKESLALYRALGAKGMTMEPLHTLIYVAWSQGRLEEAERLARERLTIGREIDVSIGHAKGDLGRALLWRGKFAEAESFLEEGVATFHDVRFSRGFVMTNIWQVLPKVHLGRYQEARAQAQMSLPLAREMGLRLVIGFSLQQLGSVTLAEAGYAEAQEALQESVVVYREIGNRGGLGWALAVLGLAARGLGDLRQARGHLHEALRTAVEIGAFLPLMYALPAIALLLADRGEVERAVELYALASRFPFVANSRWFEDVAGKQIAAVAATLPPDVVAAAQERGRARYLWDTAEELLAELEG
jgi:tetratricopeptide (TPR) repeat protein